MAAMPAFGSGGVTLTAAAVRLTPCCCTPALPCSAAGSPVTSRSIAAASIRFGSVMPAAATCCSASARTPAGNWFSCSRSCGKLVSVKVAVDWPVA